MSIITNALKKAQERHAQNQNKFPASGDKPLADKETVVHKLQQDLAAHPGIFPVLLSSIIILGLIGGLLLYLTYSTLTPSKALDTSQKIKSGIAKDARLTKNTPAPNNAERKRIAPKSIFKPDIDSASSGAKDLPELSGIMYAPELHQAILNGKAVSEGGIVNGFTVFKIYPDSVILSSGSEKTELKLR